MGKPLLSTDLSASAYALASQRLRECGFHTIPVMPGDKMPGEFTGGRWQLMAGWNKYANVQPSEALHSRWLTYPDANIGVTLGKIVDGYQICAVDWDTDREDELDALVRELPESTMKKRGNRGFTGFYRAPADLTTRKYAAKDKVTGKPRVLVEILTGKQTRQTVIPPSIHPKTGRQYEWFECAGPVPIQQLPVLTWDHIEQLEDTLRHFGWEEKIDYRELKLVDAGGVEGDGFDDPFRKVNELALQNLNAWVGQLGLPKLRPLHNGCWEAVPVWRPSIEGNPTERRKSNLKFHPTGIKDMGMDQGYTAIDVVMAAFNFTPAPALNWLQERLGIVEDDMPFTIRNQKPRSVSRDGRGNVYDLQTGEVLQDGWDCFFPATDFVNDNLVTTPVETRFKFVVERHGERSPYPPQSYLIKDWLLEKGLGLFAGVSGAGKTFVMIHTAVGLATGTEVLSRPVKKRVGTLFILGEGRASIRPRLTAACSEITDAAEGVDLSKLPITFIEATLATEAERQEVIAFAREEARRMEENFGVELGMIVVDTMAACCRFEDENSSSETTRKMEELKDIGRQLDCLVVATAHYGKTAETGVRGSSALTASADQIIAIEIAKSGHTVTHRQTVVAKLRDVEPGATDPFELEKVEIGTNAEGEAIFAARLVPTNRPGFIAVPRDERQRPLAQTAQTYLNAFEVVFSEAVEIRPYGQDGAAWKAVDREKVRAEFYAAYPADGDSEEKRKETKKKAFGNGEKLLKRLSKITTRDLDNITYVWKTRD